MKDLGYLKYFLGIEALRSNNGIFISQPKYIKDFSADTTGMIGYKPTETPIVMNHGLKIKENGKTTNQRQYHKWMRKLIDLFHTHPDIAYLVAIVSRIMDK